MGSTIYRNKKYVWFFILPAAIFMTLYLYYPFVQNIINSFQNIRGLGSPAKGWNTPWYENYVKLFKDAELLIALKNTVYMILATLIGQVGIAILLALMVDNIKHGAQFFRTVYFFPIVISATALGLLFNLMFLYNGGMVNQIIGQNIDWKDGKLSMFTLMLPVVWQYVGFYFVILATGLNNISDEYYEAAAIDGATKLQRIRYITLPLIRNVICTCAVLGVTGALKVFDLPWTMFPAGMPYGTTWLTGTYMYDVTMSRKNIDYASTIALLIVFLGIVLSKLVNKVFKQNEDYE